MRDELRALRKESVKPVSRMKKMDIASELERLRDKRESLPPVASTVATKAKKVEAKIADVKVSKEHEFPVKPVAEEKKRVGRNRLVWLLANLLSPTHPQRRVRWTSSVRCWRLWVLTMNKLILMKVDDKTL